MLESSQCGSQGAQYIDSWQNIAHNLSAAWALIGTVQCREDPSLVHQGGKGGSGEPAQERQSPLV